MPSSATPATGWSMEYTMYIPCIYHVYTMYIPCIYTWYIHGIYMVYAWYIHSIFHTPPSGWCCGGGHGCGRAPIHLRGSAYILSRRQGHARAHARTSARPRTPERASTINGEQGIGPNQMVSKLCMPVVPTVLIFKIPREQEKNVCAVHTLPPTSGQWFPTHLCVHY